MRGIQVKEYVKGPLDLRVVDLPDPTPNPDQYLIGVRASAANFFDLLQISGKYQWQPAFPWVAGAEFSGVVLATPRASKAAAAAPRFRVGDRVFGSAQGGYATRICALEAQLQPVPAGWSFVESAGLFVTMPTSYASLVTRGQVRAGEWVLVHAGAGGVGLAAVQIAKALGAHVIASAGSAHKRAVAQRFGADHVVDYTDPEWPQRVLALTPGRRGVDIVYDPVGLIEPSTKCIGWNGRLLVVGFAGGAIEKVATNRILLKNIAVVGLHWGAYAKFQPEEIDKVWAELQRLMEKKSVRATNYADKVYTGLESVPAALKALGARETWGKVVIDLPEGKESKI